MPFFVGSIFMKDNIKIHIEPRYVRENRAQCIHMGGKSLLKDLGELDVKNGGLEG